jgi:hypothetical protein
MDEQRNRKHSIGGNSKSTRLAGELPQAWLVEALGNPWATLRRSLLALWSATAGASWPNRPHPDRVPVWRGPVQTAAEPSLTTRLPVEERRPTAISPSQAEVERTLEHDGVRHDRLLTIQQTSNVDGDDLPKPSAQPPSFRPSEAPARPAQLNRETRQERAARLIAETEADCNDLFSLPREEILRQYFAVCQENLGG